MATYLDNAGLETLWSRIKNEFFRIGDKVTPTNIQISSGDIIYWDSASPTGSGDNITFHQPKFRSLPQNNRNTFVLGISNDLPNWINISSSLTQSSTASALSLQAVILGTYSSSLSLQAADATHAGIVTASAQTFAGAKTFNNTLTLGKAPTSTSAQDAVSGAIRMWAHNDETTPPGGQTETREAKQVMRFSEGRNSQTGVWTKLFLIGEGAAVLDHKTQIFGKGIDFYYDSSSKGMVLTDSGNVGIGESSPSSKLHVAGSIQAVGGGVSANGLADLSVSGGGGGSGTVNKIVFDETTAQQEYIPDQDGVVHLLPYPSDFYTTTQADSIFATQTALGVVTGKIPSAASSSNQLADKAFVNSSIATATATFRGTNTTATTEAAFLTWANGLTHSLNDYVFWQTTDANGNTIYKRYKYGYDDTETGGLGWRYEYTLNNSSFTSDQWNAINSGVTPTNWVKTADIKTLTLGSGTGTSLVYTPNSGNNRSLLAGSYLSFSISGNNATLNVSSVSDSSSASAISTGTNLVTERAIYYGLPKINNVHNYTSDTSIFAPTSGGTAGQYLKATGSTSTPVWQSFNTVALSWTDGSSSGPVLNLTPSVGSSLTATIPAARKDGNNYYSGIVTTGEQEFAGVKTFASGITIKPTDSAVSVTPLRIWTRKFQWRTQGDSEPIRQQDLFIGEYIDANNPLYSETVDNVTYSLPSFFIYAYQGLTGNPPGVNYMPLALGSTDAASKGLFYSGSIPYSGARLQGWGVGVAKPNETFDINGTLGVRGASILTGDVGVGSFTRVEGNVEAPDAKLHVKGTAHITGVVVLGTKGSPGTLCMWSKDNDDADSLRILRLSAVDNWFGIGEDVAAKGYTTSIYGNKIVLYYGTNKTVGTILDNNGVLTNVNSIQSTGGGVAAMGIADLALSGGSGGSGTVQSLQVNTATPIIPNTDGKLSLDAALTSGTTNAVSLTIGGSTLNITPSTLRTSLGLGTVYSHGYGEFVTTLGVSGNTLTWSKGGEAQTPITVPYATKASQDGDGAVITNTYLKLSGGALTGRLDATSFYVKKGNSIGTYEDVTVNGETTRNIYRLIRMAQGTEQSPSYGILINELNGGWYVNAETNLFIINVRGTNNNESTATTMASIASTGGLRSDGTSSDADTLYQTTLTLGNSLTKAATNNLSHYGRIVMYGQGTGTRKYAEIVPPTLSSNVTLTLPSSTGTLALTSDISTALTGYLPLTGGTVTTTGSTHMVFNVAESRSLDINLNDLDSFNIIKNTNQWSFVKFHGKTSSTSVVEEFGAIGFTEKSGLQARLRNAADTAWAYFNILTAKDTNLAVTYDQTETTQVNSFELTVGDVPLLMGRIDESTINELI